MVRIDRDEVLRKVAVACSGCHDVVAAYLFGSALGDMRPDSDIDVAVILRPIADFDGRAAFQRELRFEAELALRLGGYGSHPFQVTIQSASARHSFFVVNALHEAILAYVADQEALSAFLERMAYLHRRDGARHWAALAEVNGWDLRPIRRA